MSPPEALQVVGRPLVVFEPEDELAGRAGLAQGAEEEDAALVLEGRVVDLPVEQVDLVAGPPGADDPVVRPVLLLPLPEEDVAAEVVAVLRQRLLLDPGDEEEDDPLPLGRDHPPAERVVRLVPPAPGQLGPGVPGPDHQEGQVHGKAHPGTKAAGLGAGPGAL